MVRLLVLALAAAVGGGVLASSAPAETYHWPTLTPQNSGTTNRLQAISPVNDRVVWASGINGTFARTTDGGAHWTSAVVPGAEALQFRDVQGVSDQVAYLMSIGNNPTDFRIYKTQDGGKTWTMQFQNQNPKAFYDCFAFWTPNRGIAVSDSVNGYFPDIKTVNGGQSWYDIGANLPKAAPGEAQFAASGTCVATQGGHRAWIGTGGSKYAHIFATNDGGNTWTRNYVPTVQGTASSGVFSVAFRDAWHGIEGSGDLVGSPIVPYQQNIARSCDGGKTWQLTKGTPFTGAVYGVAYARYQQGLLSDSAAEAKPDLSGERPPTSCSHDPSDPQQWRTFVATGPAGAAWTSTEGRTWHLFPGVTNYWAVAFATPHAGWLVGTNGRILKISF